MADKESIPCDKCKAPIIWGFDLTPPAESNRAKEGKKGWWKEDLTKQNHTFERCKNFQETKEFEKPVGTAEKVENIGKENTQGMIKKELLDDDKIPKL